MSLFLARRRHCFVAAGRLGWAAPRPPSPRPAPVRSALAAPRGGDSMRSCRQGARRSPVSDLFGSLFSRAERRLACAGGAPGGPLNPDRPVGPSAPRRHRRRPSRDWRPRGGGGTERGGRGEGEGYWSGRAGRWAARSTAHLPPTSADL